MLYKILLLPSVVDLVSRFLSLDMTEVEAALPLVPGEETELTITTNGTLTLADLPNQALMSPGGSSDDIHRASSAVSLFNIPFKFDIFT